MKVAFLYNKLGQSGFAVKKKEVIKRETRAGGEGIRNIDDEPENVANIYKLKGEFSLSEQNIFSTEV